MPSQSTSPKKQRLTLAQLAAYDDILTDALVDHVYYWTNIRKNKIAYHSSRGIREEDVTSILQKSVIVEKDAAKAEAQMLALPGLKKFSDNLKTEKEKADFRQHLRKYVNIYLPDCPFEVSSTNRYTVVTHEAAVVARRYIKKGEVVKHLCGIQVIMTPEEEEHIKSSGRDFSIVVSSVKKSASLFLGPARFANHDCDANARLMTTGNAGMEIIAVKEIEIGDEITVSYGENYFGEDNCECLCTTCEERCQNGWSAGEDGEQLIPKLSIEDETSADGYSLRRRRRPSYSDSSRDQSETPDINIRPRVPKRTPRSLSRFKNAESPLRKSLSVEPSRTPLKRKREEDLVSPSPSRSSKKTRPQPFFKTEESRLNISILASMENSSGSAYESPSGTGASSPSRTDGQTGTDATSVDDDTIIVEPPQQPPTKIFSPTISRLKKTKANKQSPLEQAKSGEPILVGDSTSAEHPAIQDDTASVLSIIDSELFADIEESFMPVTPSSTAETANLIKDENTITVTQKVRKESKESKESKKRKKVVLPSPKNDLDYAPPIRTPGDYVLTPRLLAEPAAAWINCKICEESFVQKDAYFTRSSCPRCERHSKLYGYMWPKTDKEGKDDTEERVLDHRTVHRFIKPSEEKTIRKRNRSATESRGVTREVSETVLESESGKTAKGKGSRVKRDRFTL